MKISKTISLSNCFSSKFRSLVVALFILTPALCLGKGISEGTDYVKILEVENPVQSTEVIEYFSIGCKYCPPFKSMMENWYASQAKQIWYQRVPVILSLEGTGIAPSVNNARAYYIAQALKILPQAEPVLDKAVAEDNNALNTPEKIIAIFTEMGVSPEKVRMKYDSFEVRSNIRVAIALTDLLFLRTKHFSSDVTKPNLVDRKYLLANDPISQEMEHHGTGTPMLVINRKFKTNLRMANKDRERLFEIVNYLMKMDN